jgi:hypothetical protein
MVRAALSPEIRLGEIDDFVSHLPISGGDSPLWIEDTFRAAAERRDADQDNT